MRLTSLRRVVCASLLLALIAPPVSADPLSKRTEIDFFRDVPSRNLKGLAARSDGRLISGPLLAELTGNAPADLLWSLAPTADPAKWLVGTGPDGKIFEVTVDAAKSAFVTREIVKLDESHVFALTRLPDGSVLAGTSPKGALCLVRDDKLIARVALPVDSIFDVLPIDARTALVSTGNPGRIYSIDLKQFAAAGITPEKITGTKALAGKGITLFGEIRDRNVRRIAQLNDGRIVAGSAPKGNIYEFAKGGGAPTILQENRDAEVTDLLPAPDGGLYATLTFSGGTGEGRITPPKTGAKEIPDTLAFMSAAPDRFTGRSSLIWFPPNGFPETLTARTGAAFYRIARQGQVLLLTGGEQGDMLGYDLINRVSLTFAGSTSSQLNGLAPIPGQAGKFLVLRNNAPGLALLDFTTAAPREAETRRLDLGAPALLGSLRFSRLRDLEDRQLSIEAKTSNGSDDVEGWSPWMPLRSVDGGWSVPDQRGRYVKYRLKLPADAKATAQVGKAALYALPQNRRPVLQDFHVLSSNFGIVPVPESVPPTIVSVGQVMQAANAKDDDSKRKSSFLGSQIVPSPGAQVVIWNVNDPDGDNVRCTFSIRRDGEETYTDLALNTRDTFVQFDTSTLADGLYFTRLTATESEPRPKADRLTTTFETDDLIVDHTPPEMLESSAKRIGDHLVVSVHGRDALSLLDGIEVVFNNGQRDQTEESADGVRDSREETFTISVPISRIADASSVEVVLYDATGNTVTKRLSW
ncbi:MAG: hypothetical protein ABIV50_15165 [Opitutus sp.]